MMKKKVFVLTLLMLSILGLTTEAKTPKTETTQYWVSMHCATCQQKIMDNLAFEKGVKDIIIDLDKRTVDVKYSTKKTDAAKIQAAIEKLGFEVKVMNAGDIPAVSTVAAKGCCAYGAGEKSTCKGKAEEAPKHDCQQKSSEHKCQGAETTEKHKCQGEKGEAPKCKGESTSSASHSCQGKADTKDHVCCQGKEGTHKCCKDTKQKGEHKCTGHQEGDKAPHKCNHQE